MPNSPARPLVFALFLAGCASNVPLLLAQRGSGCRPADSQVVPAHLSYLTLVVSETDSVSQVVRDSLWLPLTSPSKVRLVTRATTCTSAVSALNALVGTPGQVRQVWVYALDRNYAVEDPTLVDPAGKAFYLFDSKWKPKPILIQ